MPKHTRGGATTREISFCVNVEHSNGQVLQIVVVVKREWGEGLCGLAVRSALHSKVYIYFGMGMCTCLY